MTLLDKLGTATVKTTLRLTFKPASGLPLPFTLARMALELGARVFPVRKEVTVVPVTLGGSFAEWIMPRTASSKTDQVILHLHGGAFFAGSPRSHRALGSELAVRTGNTVYMLDYPRAPEHPYPIPLNAARHAYDALVALGYRPDQIVLGGDSGGCALALLLCQSLRDDQQPMPAGIFLISPYIDLTLSADSVTRNRHKDPMVSKLALQRGADGFRGDIPARDPRVSPVFANFEGLPPILVQVGSSEIIVDDATLLALRAKQAGVTVDLQIFDGMWHNFQMFNMLVKEADHALDQIATFVTHLDKMALVPG